MNICEHTILEILKDKIKIMDEIVPVIVSKRFKDTTPSISLDTTSTNPVSERYSYNCLLPLNLNHPLYDKDNPNKLYADNDFPERGAPVNKIKPLFSSCFRFIIST